MRRKFLAGILTVSMLLGMISITPAEISSADGKAVREVVLRKSTGNPMLGFDDKTDVRYAGDPAVMVDGDTVYAYAGFDNCPVTAEYYSMPRWICYSSKDMINWTYEGVHMEASDVSWAQNTNEAWAAQTIRYGDKYYFYYCTTERSTGFKTVGVGVSESPTGPFRDIGQPLIPARLTTVEDLGGDAGHAWKDIDPTVWVDTDENGKEHRYLAWGNTYFYTCELNEDMISVKDQNGDGKIDMNDIVEGHIYNYPSGQNFTEAPWLYRRKDENGNYYGKYYLFYAGGWREQMCYATTDDPMSGKWEYGGLLMPPSATANTNHMGVIDFKGKTYFIYHNGSLPGGSGYRRVACVEEFSFNENGSIDPIQETATGLAGIASEITNASGGRIAHEAWVNTQNDSDYPITGKKVSCSWTSADNDSRWEINPGKADKSNEAYVSIESYNKPGMYLSASGNSVVLSHDYDASETAANNMTFRTIKGLAGYGVTFESVSEPGHYIVNTVSGLMLSDAPDSAEDATFVIDTESDEEYLAQIDAVSIEALKRVRTYNVGDTLRTDDIKVTAELKNGNRMEVSGYTTNAGEIDMNTPGEKVLTVYYTRNSVTLTYDIPVYVADMTYTPEPTKAPLEPTQAPTDPTKAPAEPTQAPTEPTKAPAEPTQAPTEPTKAPEPTPTEQVQFDPAPTEPVQEPEPTKAPEPTQTPPVTDQNGSAQTTVQTPPSQVSPSDQSQVPADSLPLPAAGQTYKADKLKYKVTKSAAANGQVTVTGEVKKNCKSIVIPASVIINGYKFKVTAIKAKAFAKNKKLKRITIGKNVKKIGKKAFYKINKKAVFKVDRSRYKAVKKLLGAKTGYRKTMKIKRKK